MDMNNTKTKIGLGVLALIVGGALFIVFNPANTNTQTIKTPDTTNTTTPPPSNTTLKNYTMAEVSTHNNAQNCWTAIDGNVYNVTSWINQHPGGAQAIISLCGIDGSSAFNGQHGGQKRPASELQKFLIGKLK
jgi:cytochrome b involved in lipid metabolism